MGNRSYRGPDPEVRTISDEEFLSIWAKENIISGDVVETLRQESFTFMESFKLIDRDDPNKPKLAISKGQQQ